MKHIPIIIIFLIPICSFSQSTPQFHHHELSIGQRFHFFTDWKFSEPLNIVHLDTPSSYLNSFSYAYHFNKNEGIRLNYNLYTQNHLAPGQTTDLEPPYGEITSRFFLTYELLYERSIFQFLNPRHQLKAGIGISFRDGMETIVLDVHPTHPEFEPNLFRINMNGLGIPYSLSYQFYATNWFSLKANMGGAFYYPTKSIHGSLVARATPWSGYLEARAAFHFF